MFNKVLGLGMLVALCACNAHSTTASPKSETASASGEVDGPDSLEESVSRGVEAAHQWLVLIDAAHYAESWTTAASLFKSAVRQEEWENAAQTVRGPLGKLRSRELRSRDFKSSLPRVPEGRYVVVKFDTSFENKPSAVETVTAAQEQDGSWRVAGYFVK